MSVDLPEPDGPMIAVNRAAGMARSTPSSARTAASPRPWTFTRPTARAAARACRGASNMVTVSPEIVERSGVSPRARARW